MQAQSKYLYAGLAVAAAVGLYLYSKENGIASEPTFKSTPLSTLPEMKADLLSWSQRTNETGWNGKQPLIYQALLQMGDTAIRNMHALLWDAWQPNRPQNYAYTVNWDLTPASWDNSIGKWWENFSKAINV